MELSRTIGPIFTITFPKDRSKTFSLRFTDHVLHISIYHFNGENKRVYDVGENLVKVQLFDK